MTKLQKVSCIFLSFIFFAVLAMAPGPFFLRGNVYRQFPLYCFLEQKARRTPLKDDPETYEILMENNAKYLVERMETENIRSGGEEQNKTETADTEEAVRPTQSPSVSSRAKPSAVPSVTARPALAKIKPAPVIDLAPETLADYDYLLNEFFIVDEETATNAEQLNAAEFLEKDFTIKKDPAKPQILIYHSHSQETFADSREGRVEDTIVGVGSCLKKILTETYGYQVLHVTEEFDLAGGSLDRSKAYDYARPHIEQLLQENPSIEVVIDLHRDGVAENRRLVTEINGKATAQIMFFNGLSYTLSKGTVDYLPNPYIQDNLSFSFQMEYQAAQYYPDFYRGIYLSGLRYNLDLKKRAVLLEAGAQTNTVQEVKNAMEPFADILNRVLTGE